MSRNDNLPIFEYKNEILSLIKENDVSIIIGETGSGKSTFLPMFLYENGFTNNTNKIIGITQPRRIAAISLAEYVSKLMKTTIGNEVGYSVRFKTVISKNTKIKYLTDGMLIRECITTKGGLFNKYCVIIIDEAHERSIRTDFLLGLLKMELNNGINKNVKIIIMSATFQYEKFISFFNSNDNNFKLKIGTYNILGRQFPVKINYLQEPEVDYLEAIKTTILLLHFTKPKNGDILVFLPGQDEILQLYNNLNDLNKEIESLYEKDGYLSFFFGKKKYENIDKIKLHIQCLYASMPAEEQSKVFNKLPDNYRKVILATNIAETSVTLPNIVYVIDSGLEKLKYFYNNNNIDVLSLNVISKASAIQRAGRAGRVKPGEVYRIYTKESYEKMLSTQIPEILRTSLSETLLELIYILDNYSIYNNNKNDEKQHIKHDMSVKKILDFPFIDYPNKESILSTLRFLYRLEALNINGNITELGVKLTMLPVIPILGKLIYHSIEFNCTSEAITLVSMISAECFLDYCNNNSNKRPRFKKTDINSYKNYIRSIMVKYGDHVGLIETFNTWISFKNNNIKNNYFNNEQISFCNNLGLSNINMIRAKSIRDQLIQITIKIFNLKTISSCIINNNNYEKSENDQENKWTPLLKCLTKSFWQNTAKLDLNNKQYITEINRQIVNIHPTSSICHIKEKPRWIIYNDIIQTKKMYIKIISPINHLWLNDYCSKWFISQKKQD